MDVLNIPEYVLQVLARLGPPKAESDGWVFLCPCPTHSGKGEDHNPSLRVTIGDEGKIIVHCRTGCSTDEVLASVGLSFADLYCPMGEVPADPLLGSESFAKIFKEVPVGLLNKVYNSVLSSLSLHDSHIDDLKRRGITVEEANRYQYKSLLTNFDQNNLKIKLNELYGQDLLLVPGFRENLSVPGTYEFAIDPKGMIIPIRNPNGDILALKTRRPITPKYILWSTRNGPSAGMPVHCPLNAPQECSTIRITEGEIKADHSRTRSETYTISIPGVNAWPSALPLLEALQPKRVLLSFDYPDVLYKGGVSRLLRLFSEELVSRGYEIGLETWDVTNPLAKGIDDVYTLGITPANIWGAKALETIRKIHEGEKSLVNFFTEGEPAPFPMSVFPTCLREFISQHSQSIQCPEDFMATAVLATAGRALGTTRAIGMDNYWTELPNQYMCIVAPPSSGKSPACKRVLKPIRQNQIKDANRYTREKKLHIIALIAWKEQCRIARTAGTLLPTRPAPVRAIEHYWVSDITVETVAKRLHDNSLNVRHDPALLYYRDEILAWIKSLNAYRGGKGADREFFLSCWSNEDVKVDRKTEDETIIVSSPALTILGGIQPDLLSELNNDSGKDDGFFARLLFSYPNTKIGFEPSSFVPDADLDGAWDLIVRKMLALSPSENPEDVNEDHKTYKPKVIPLSTEALAVYNEWLMADTQMMRSPTFPRNLISAWGKHRAIVARFALVMHYLYGCSIPDPEYPIDQPITATALKAAIQILEYFRSHFQRVSRRMVYSPEEQKVEDFVRHILVAFNGAISIREIYKKKLFKCTGKESAESLCKLAVDRGFGTLEKTMTGGRPGFVFLVQGNS